MVQGEGDTPSAMPMMMLCAAMPYSSTCATATARQRTHTCSFEAEWMECQATSVNLMSQRHATPRQRTHTCGSRARQLRLAQYARRVTLFVNLQFRGRAVQRLAAGRRAADRARNTVPALLQTSTTV